MAGESGGLGGQTLAGGLGYACSLRLADKKGRLKVYRTYGAFSNGALIATAKVNLAGAVYWRTPWPGEKWEVE